jgi:gamma-glutamyltranspeptidase/glutathione hydrolase
LPGPHCLTPGLALKDGKPFLASAVQAGDTREMGYRLDFQDRTSGPINAIFFDWKHGSFWADSSNHGEDYGIAW